LWVSSLAGDRFELLAGQLHSENYGGKGVKYLVSRKGVVMQEELGLDAVEDVESSAT